MSLSSAASLTLIVKTVVCAARVSVMYSSGRCAYAAMISVCPVVGSREPAYPVSRRPAGLTSFLAATDSPFHLRCGIRLGLVLCCSLWREMRFKSSVLTAACWYSSMRTSVLWRIVCVSHCGSRHKGGAKRLTYPLVVKAMNFPGKLQSRREMTADPWKSGRDILLRKMCLVPGLA